MHYFSIDEIDKFTYQWIPFLIPGQPLLLSGPMGVGKTTFAKHLIQHVCPKGYFPSPSFPIVMIHQRHSGENLCHMDLYRISKEEELETLDIPFYLAHEACIIEWPQNLGKWKPLRYWSLQFSFTNQENLRALKAQNHKGIFWENW